MLSLFHMDRFCFNDCMQRRKRITDDEVKAFMDANRQIVPTLGKKISE